MSALQSRVYNEVVAQRIDSLGQLLDGDFAYKHENGACFLRFPEDLREAVLGRLGADAPGELDDPRWGELMRMRALAVTMADDPAIGDALRASLGHHMATIAGVMRHCFGVYQEPQPW